MYTLLSQIYASWTRKDEYSVLILGLDNAGKSTLLESLKRKMGQSALDVDKITPTIGQNIARFTYGRTTKYQFWDLGGQEALRAMWSNYYSSAHLLVFVIDASNTTRLEESTDVLYQLSEDTQLHELPILVLANKLDTATHMSVAEIKGRVVEYIERIDPKEGSVLGCSGLAGTGLDEVMAWIDSRVKRNAASRPPLRR